MKSLVSLILIICVVVSSEARTIRRHRRGILSRTGFCPVPWVNKRLADNRLNYLGFPLVFRKPNGRQNECSGDDQCSGNNKCCMNTWGGQVCTPADRGRNPCEGYCCPKGQVCNVRKVKCVDPICPSLWALNRPTCVPAKGLGKNENLKDVGNHIPDTTADLMMADATEWQRSDGSKCDPRKKATPQQDDEASFLKDTAALENSEEQEVNQPLSPFVLQQGPNQALSYTDQSQAPQPFDAQADTQGAPLAPADASLLAPAPAAPLAPADTTGMTDAQFTDPNSPAPQAFAPAPEMDVASLNAAPLDNAAPQQVAQSPEQIAQYAPQPDTNQPDPNAGLMPLTQ